MSSASPDNIPDSTFPPSQPEVSASKKSNIANEDYVKILCEHSPDSIVLTDHQGSIQIFNDSFEDFIQHVHNKKVSIGATLSEIWAESEEAELWQSYRDMVVSGETVSVEHSFQYGNFGERFFEITFRPFIQKDIILGFTETYRDVTSSYEHNREIEDLKERLEFMFTHSAAGVYQTLETGEIVDCNDAFAQILGLESRIQAIGMNASEFYYSDDDRDRFLAKLKEESFLRNHEWEMVKKNGDTLWIIENVIIEEKDGVNYLFGSLIDISARKNSENRLRKKLQNLVSPESQSDILYFDDLFDPKEIQNLQDALSYTTGVASIITGPDGTPITDPGKHSHLFDDIDDILKLSSKQAKKQHIHISKIFIGGNHIANWIIRQITNFKYDSGKLEAIADDIGLKKKNIKQAFSHASALSEEQFGRISHAISLMANQMSSTAFHNFQQAKVIAEKEQAEFALLDSEEKYRNLIQNSPDGITVMDIEGNILDCNSSFETLIDYSRDDIIGKNITEFVADDKIEEVRNAFSSFQVKRSQEIRLELKRKDGTLISVWRKGVSLIDQHHQVTGIIAYDRDITEDIKLRDKINQSTKMEAIGRLSGGIAHDFNNLIMSISGNAELALMSMSENDPLVEDLKEIVQSSERASSLTQQLLTFSKQQSIEARVLNINSVVKDLNRLLLRTLGDNIILETDLEKNLWNIHIDRSQIEQIIVNLALNSRDAMANGGKLTINTKSIRTSDSSRIPDLKEQEYVLLKIKDNGEGIPEENLVRIFEPFFTTKGEGIGTGLGLSTVFGIVEQNGGQIFVESEVNEGTSFSIYLPKVEAEEDPDIETVINGEDLLGEETILVVEDNSSVRNSIVKSLQKYHYTVLDAESGMDAIALLRRTDPKPDLIVTDILMPGISGKELSQKIMEMGIKSKIIFMSGYTEDNFEFDELSEDSLPFIQKPFKPIELLQTVREILDEK